MKEAGGPGAAVGSILDELNAVMEDTKQWASGTRCRQTRTARRRGRPLETRYYSFVDLMTVYAWLAEAIAGKPLSAGQIEEAHRILGLTRWHRPAAEATGRGGRISGNIWTKTAPQIHENIREIRPGGDSEIFRNPQTIGLLTGWTDGTKRRRTTRREGYRCTGRMLLE